MKPELIISASTANLYDSLTKWQGLFWGPEEHIRLVMGANLDGVELWPMNPLTGICRRNSRLSDWASCADNVISCHQTPRGENLLGLLRALSKGDVRYIGSYLLMQDPKGSLRYISKLSREIKMLDSQEELEIKREELTTNIYPELVKPGDLRGVPSPVVQTYPKGVAALGARSIEELTDKAKEKKLGICYSTLHSRRFGENGRETFLAEWQRVIPALAKSGLLKQVHLEVARADAPGLWQDVTIQEALDLIRPHRETTLIKRMMEELADNWRGHITIEALPSGVDKITPHPAREFDVNLDMGDFYQRTGDYLRQVFKS